MDRNHLIRIFSFTLLLSYSISSYSTEINRCLWDYASTPMKVKIINDKAAEVIKNKRRESIRNENGDMITYDFIPGSKTQEPFVMNGGLQYKIEYFEMFSGLLTTQSLVKETLLKDAEQQIEKVKQLIADGHPIIIPARATQPESIYASLKARIVPSFAGSLRYTHFSKMKANPDKSSLSLADHASDIRYVLNHLIKTGQIGADAKIQLASLSYGVNVLREYKMSHADTVLHSSIIAPLAYAGDNYKDATQKQNELIKMGQMMFAPLKWNPLTYALGDFYQKFVKNYTLSLTANSYSKKLAEGSLANDPDFQAKEKEFPGFIKLVAKGLANDMDAARADIFQLGDPNYFHLYKNSTIYLAGDEEPVRLKAQLDAVIKMKKALGDKAPNLVIMDDAQHATTASAPLQTVNMLTAMMLKDVSESENVVFYMHRQDPQARVIVLNQELFDIITKEIENEAIGPASASQLEAIYFPGIFINRVQMTAQAVKDIAEALKLEHKEPLPAGYKEDPSRPYLGLRYIDLTAEMKEQLNTEIEALSKKLQEYNQVQASAEKIIKKMNDETQQQEKK